MQDTAPRSGRFQCVLVPFDFSEASHHALQVAAAQFGHPGATLALLHAVEPDGGVSEHAQLHGQLVNTRVQEAQRQLEALARPLRAAWAEVQVLASLGDPKDVILSTAELVHADLVVMGSHGATGWRALFGGTTYHVARKLGCSVLVLRPERKA
jgi:nucleotide-binding universal stress UspA family protein